ncbi:MAG: hypothetical protein AVDCRST_MAG31-1711, partial [uncultured Sphingomonas sp.]
TGSGDSRDPRRGYRSQGFHVCAARPGGSWLGVRHGRQRL